MLTVRQAITKAFVLAPQYMKAAMHMVSKADFIILIHHFATSNFSECITDSDCPDYLACGEDEECVDPCPYCTVNAHCEASNHEGICTCNSGHEGCNAYGK